MKKTDLESRIKELERELASQKSIGAEAGKAITEATETREETNRQKELLQRVIDNIPVMITYFDKNGRIILTNQELVKVLGWTSNEWETENIFVKCYPEPEYCKEVLEYMDSGQAGWKECKTSTKTGVQINTTWTNIKLSDGFSIGIGMDLTERKLNEELLRQNFVFSETLLKTIPFGMHIVDETGDILFQSDNLKKLFSENAIGKKCWELYRDDKKQCGECPLHHGIIIGQTENYESQGVLGNRIFDISHTGMIFQGKKAMLEIFQDITQRKQIELKLLRSERELRKAQEITHIGSWHLDVTTNEVFWTEELYKMYGFNPSLPPPSYTEHMKLFTPESWALLSSSLAVTSKTGVPYELELQTVRRDNSNGWMWVRGEAITDSKGNITGLWGAAQDISERKKREELMVTALEKVKESERLKSAFLANVSHEIRTPMNGILGFTELLKEPNLTSDEQQSFIQTIEKSGARMLNTINSIIDISKIESGLVRLNMKTSNINEKLEFAYKFFKPEVDSKGLQFSFRNGLSTKESSIKTDNEKIYGILTNLIKNAIKFTSKGFIEFGYDKKGGYLEFFVKDSGQGIGAQQKEFIFDRFRQGSEALSRNYEGSGLGLTIAKSYIEMMGGKIWLESAEGTGTTFYFTIPYIPESKSEPETKDKLSNDYKEVQLKNLKILIVEDDEISYSMLSRAVQKISKEVLHAITGIEAVEICMSNPDLDLILMDIRMPQMNGNEATRLIRQFNKEVIIIAQTAYGFSSDCEKAFDAGCNDYISKPIKFKALVDLIKKHMKKH